MKKITTGESRQLNLAKNAEKPRSKSSPKVDKITTLTNRVTKPWRRSKIKAMEEHYNRQMDILNAVQAHLKEIKEEVETKRNLLATFMKEIDAAIKKALKNLRETPLPSNPACRKADDVLRKVMKDDNDADRFVLPKQMRDDLNVVKEKLKAQKRHAEANKRQEELQEGVKEATGKAENIAALVDEVDAAMKKVRSQHIKTARPEIEACRLADEYLTRATNGQTISRKDMLEGEKMLNGAVEGIESLYRQTKDAHEKAQREWDDAKRSGDISKLQRIQGTLQNQIALCRSSVFTDDNIGRVSSISDAE